MEFQHTYSDRSEQIFISAYIFIVPVCFGMVSLFLTFSGDTFLDGSCMFTSFWGFEDHYRYMTVYVVWRFPELGVPIDHQFLIGLSVINHPFWVSLFMELFLVPRSRSLRTPSVQLAGSARVEYGEWGNGIMG